MSAAAEFPRFTKADVFARLAEGLQAGVTVVTPNRRLAQELTREFDADRLASGLLAWEAADILPFGSFVERLWESVVYSEHGADTPLLLSPPQEQALWEEIIGASPWGAQLLTPARASAQCRERACLSAPDQHHYPRVQPVGKDLEGNHRFRAQSNLRQLGMVPGRRKL